MNLNETVQTFMQENQYESLSERFVIIRNDGICVYSNAEDTFESASICALVSALWQAGKSLNSLVSSTDDFSEHRLSFDTSETGLYILPIKILKEEYYLCSIYEKNVNPAKLKQTVRVLKDKLEDYLSTKDFSSTLNRSGYLFKDITDQEIDKIFEHNR